MRFVIMRGAMAVVAACFIGYGISLLTDGVVTCHGEVMTEDAICRQSMPKGPELVNNVQEQAAFNVLQACLMIGLSGMVVVGNLREILNGPPPQNLNEPLPRNRKKSAAR